MTPTHPRRRGKSFDCRVCGGPCRQYAGSVHGWTCRQCLQRHLDNQPDPPVKTTVRRERQINERETTP